MDKENTKHRNEIGAKMKTPGSNWSDAIPKTESLKLTVYIDHARASALW